VEKFPPESSHFKLHRKMSIFKFKVGDLVHRHSPHNRDYWEGRVGIVVSITYTHGDPSVGVKWSRIQEIRTYKPSGLQPLHG
jgi:hypothetical protein